MPKNVHSKIREAHATEIAEDYVEAIADVIAEKGTCRAVDLVDHFSVTPATVSNTVGRLARDGLVETARYRPITLTQAGKRMASMARERHAVVMQFLRKLGVSEEAAAVDSEGIEHHVGRETLAAMRKVVKSGWPRK